MPPNDFIAQTNLQLLNQLRRQERPLEDLILVQGAITLANRIYAAALQADDRPFVCHVCAVSSILAFAGCETSVVAAGALHNVYGNGDFGDGREYVVTPRRRRMVRDAVGDEVESLILGFFHNRDRLRFDRIDVARLTADEKTFVLIDIADLLERLVDDSVLFFGNNDWAVREIVRERDDALRLARELGKPELAELGERLFAQYDAANVPAEMMSPSRERFLHHVTPLSMRTRPSVKLMHAAKKVWLPIRRRLRARRA